VEVWTTGAGVPGFGVRQARRAEDEGWDGIGFVDSQNLAGDPFVELGLAAGATSTLLLATAVTNPLTRHPATMATAAATIQAESAGRFVLGIGRGDSSLAHLGLAPAPVKVLRHYVERLQGYLRGEDVPFDVAEDGSGEIAPVASLGLAGGPQSSRLHWLSRDASKVPVDIAATGPKVISTGAVLGDRVTFAVGCDPERIRWAVGTARQANADIALGAYVPVFVHPDREVARSCIAGGVASYARFSVMHGSVTGPVGDTQRGVLEAVHDAYDMGRHFSHGSPQSVPLTDEVIDAFGIAGPSSYCVERLLAMAAAGLTKLVIMAASIGLDRDAQREARRRFVEEVLPALR
jgi:5,10-methylenetetrahydromethanopterin reductase